MSAPPTRQGQYPIEPRAGEIERLNIQGDAIAADAAIMLDRIGVKPGWHCIDLGCGPRGLTDLLSARCGTNGQVIGLDGDGGFIDHARREAAERGFKNVDFMSGDAYSTGLQDNTFDLVHSRFVASTAGQPEKLLQEGIRLARPGRFVAFQEPDIATLNCYPPHAAWQRIKSVLEEVFKIAGANVRLAQELYQFFRGSGLTDVQYRTFLIGFRSTDPMVDYLPATAKSLRRALIGHGLITSHELDAVIADCRAHLGDPNTTSTYCTVMQVWGTKPA